MITKKSSRSIWITRPTPQDSPRRWTRDIATRRTAGAAILCLLNVLLLGAMACGGPGLLVAPAAAATQPNIVVIMTDDQTVESLRVMPKTLSLIGGGTTFRNSYVSYPLCCPSRATYLTGQYPHNHGVFGNKPPFGGYTKLDHTNTLPLWLQGAGYFTSHIGKYLNGYGDESQTEVPPGWSDWQGLVGRGTYSMYNYTINDNGKLVTYRKGAKDYQTDVLADRATETIGAAVAKQPFFINIAVLAPHIEGAVGLAYPRPAPRHLTAFAKVPLPQPPSFNEANVSDKPAKIRALPSLTPTQVRDITERYRKRLGSLLAVDDLVERVVMKLAERGVLHNTALVFTSDNGFFHGEHRIPDKKGRVYEAAARVPLLIRGVGFPEGVIASQFVSNTDLAPTIVELAGASAGGVMDGRSLLPLALDPDLGRDRNLLIETRDYRAVRNGSFLYVEHKTGEQELYDMRQGTPNYDPYQLESRHGDRAYNQIKSQLAAKLSQLRTCTGASCGP